MRAKRGFILAYATVIMAFVMILITGIVTLVDTSASIGIRASMELDERMRLDQLGEYFAAGRDTLLVPAVTGDYVVAVESQPTKDVMTVSHGGEVVLYVERQARVDASGYDVICWIYGSKSE